MSAPPPQPHLLSSLATATSERSRERLLEESPLLAEPSVVEALCEQAAQWLREDPARARGAASAALWLARSISDPRSQGLAHRTLGNILASLAHTSEASTEYNAALEIFTQLDESLQAAITRSSALPIVTETEGTDAAFEWAEEARRVFKENHDHLRLARLENNLAVLLFRQEDFERALEHWKTANRTLQEIGETSDQAATLRNLAVCSISLNQPNQAKVYYRQARAICEKQGFTFILHEIDYNIAYLHYLQGDHHTALALYQKARHRSHELGDRYHEALCSLDEAEIYIELNLLHEADTVSRLAVTQFRTQKKPYETAKALFNLALVRARLGDTRSALGHLDSASVALMAQRNILWPGQIDLLRATLFFGEGRYFEAKRFATRAFSRFQTSKLRLRQAQSSLVLAKIEHQQGAYDKAATLCRQATQALQDLAEPNALFQAYFLLGVVLESQGDTSGALDAFARAEGYLMELRERRSASQYRVSIVEDPLALYAHRVGLLIGEERAADLSAEVFRLIETAKARSFADLMALSTAKPFTRSTMRSQLVDQVSELRQELSWLYRRIDRSELPDTDTRLASIDALRAASRAKEDELAEKLSQLRVRTPPSGADPERIGISNIRTVQGCLKGRILLEYYIAHDVVLALILSARHQKVFPIAVASRVRDMQRQLWHHLHHRPRSSQPSRLIDPLHQLLRDLYVELLGPLEHLLQGAPLIVVPHSFLFLLPFHMLRSKRGYLFELLPVSYLPSAAKLAHLHSEARQDGLPPPSSQKEILVKDAAYAQCPNDRADGWRSGKPASSAPIELQSEWAFRAHIQARAALRGDNPLFSTVSRGIDELTLIDLHRTRLLQPALTIEGKGFSPDSPSGHREVAALWDAILASGARSACVPTDFGASSFHQEHSRLFFENLSLGHDSALAHRLALLALLDGDAPSRDLASIFLIGDPDLKDPRIDPP